MQDEMIIHTVLSEIPEMIEVQDIPEMIEEENLQL